MPNPFRSKFVLIFVVFFCPSANATLKSFDISFITEGFDTSNALGLAIDPLTSDVYMTTLSYNGADNLWRMDANGQLLESSRVNVDLGPFGAISSADFTNDGNLVVLGTQSRFPDPADRFIVTLSTDGQTEYSRFQTDQYFGGTSGIAFNPFDESIILSTGRVGVQSVFREVAKDGTLIDSLFNDPALLPNDIAFDAASGNLFATRENKPLLDEYRRDENGYTIVRSYDLTDAGLSRRPLALGIAPSNGLFYVQDNNQRIVSFNTSDLAIIAVSAPATWGFILVCLVFIMIRRKGNMNQ